MNYVRASARFIVILCLVKIKKTSVNLFSSEKGKVTFGFKYTLECMGYLTWSNFSSWE